jgi:hypothetical protein
MLSLFVSHRNLTPFISTSKVDEMGYQCEGHVSSSATFMFGIIQ